MRQVSEDIGHLDSFYGAIDPLIRPLVRLLRDNGIETTESCQGGEGHGDGWPWITFRGGEGDGRRAMYLADRVWMMERCWEVVNGKLAGTSFWRMKLYPLRKAGEESHARSS